MFLTVLAYGFNTGWMPFATTSDNYLSVVSSFLVFVELSFVQAIRAGMVRERLWEWTRFRILMESDGDGGKLSVTPPLANRV